VLLYICDKYPRTVVFVVAACSTDIISKNIALATQKIQQYNVMPVYGEFLV